jgi:hypothetical protein
MALNPQQQEAYDELPDPGYAREEELRQRNDALTEQAETMSAEREVYAMQGTEAFEPDPEILRHFEQGNLPVSNASKAYRYCWVQRDPNNRYGNMHIMRKKVEGWELVVHDMPEAREHKFVDGTRVVGDVALMRIRLDRWLLLERQAIRRRNRRVQRNYDAIHNEAERANSAAGGKLVDVVENADEATLQRLQRKSDALKMTQNYTDKLVREGKMPGVHAPGTPR